MTDDDDAKNEFADSRLDIKQCRHGTLAVLIGGVQVTPARCCGKWKTIYETTADSEALLESVTMRRACVSCNKIFNWNMLARRRGKKPAYCSGTCRQSQYRSRQNAARVMSHDGHDFKTIARILNTTEGMARSWVYGRL